MPQDQTTRRDRSIRISHWLALAFFLLALLGALLDGRLLTVVTFAVLTLVMFAQATGLGELSPMARRLTVVLILVGLVLAATYSYTSLASYLSS